MKRIIAIMMILGISINLLSCTTQTEESGELASTIESEKDKEPTYHELYETLGEEEQLFMKAHGETLVLYYCTYAGDAERFISLKGVYEDNEGRVYIDVLVRNEEKIVLATPNEDYIPGDSLASKYSYRYDYVGGVIGETPERLNLDIDAINQCLLVC